MHISALQQGADAASSRKYPTRGQRIAFTVVKQRGKRRVGVAACGDDGGCLRLALNREQAEQHWEYGGGYGHDY